MWAQLIAELKQIWQDAQPRVRRTTVSLRHAARGLWSVVRPPLVFVLQIVAALIILFEEWGWQPLVDALSGMSRFSLWARLELWIAGLPPYGALCVFAVPVLLLLPLKFVALYLLADGRAFAAGLLFIGAKLASTAFIARIFMLTKPALMRIGWFARAYDWFTPWKDAFFAMIRASWPWRYGRMVKTRVKLEAKQAWVRWRPMIEGRMASVRVWLTVQTAEARDLARRAWARLRPQLREQAVRARLAIVRLLEWRRGA